MTPAHDVLRQADHVLLDFDGPVCAVFSTITNTEVTNGLRACLTEHGHTPTDELRHATDPFDVLAYALGISADLAAAVEAEFTRWEQHAVQYAAETPGIRDTLAWITQSGHSITIVTNNAVSAVTAYCTHTGLDTFINNISARRPHEVTKLKPHPYFLLESLNALNTKPQQAVMVGDSTSDIEAATAANVPAIAYANKPGKTDTLTTYHPQAIITHMTELLPPTPSPARH